MSKNNSTATQPTAMENPDFTPIQLVVVHNTDGWNCSPPKVRSAIFLGSSTTATAEIICVNHQKVNNSSKLFCWCSTTINGPSYKLHTINSRDPTINIKSIASCIYNVNSLLNPPTDTKKLTHPPLSCDGQQINNPFVFWQKSLLFSLLSCPLC